MTRWQLRLGGLALLLSAGWILYAVHLDPSVIFLTRTGDPDWITPWTAIDTDGIRVDLDDPPAFTFVQRFDLPEATEAPARIRVRAPGQAELRLNETLLWSSSPDASWKRAKEITLEQPLRPRGNEIRVRVTHTRGPALLQLRLRDARGQTLVESDASWRAVGPDGGFVETMRARDTRPDPQSFSVPSTGSVLVEKAAPLGLLFALGVLICVALRGGLPAAAIGRAPEATLALACVFWVAVYVTRSSGLPVLMGFDIVGHLAYVQVLVERGRVPLATEGWSMYHPPFGHALIALMAVASDFSASSAAPEGAAARWLMRLPGFVAGLANVWAVWFAARRLFRNDPLRTSLATGFAALLPMNVYTSAYVSNEPVHTALVSVSLCLAGGLLVSKRTSHRRLALLSASLGLAVLTKFTALLAVPLVAAGVFVKRWRLERVPLSRALASGVALGIGVFVIAGWFYLRSWLRLGRPVVGNWDLPGRVGWWEQPGFHTWDYYTSFGQALSHPFFAGYASFWDGVYSTFWGDGLAAGMVKLATRHDAWRYDFMTAGYWLAFPATLLIAIGGFRALRYALTDPDRGRRLAMSLLLAFAYTAGFALLAITFRLPYYAQAKAFYVLCAILPISLLAGMGLSWPLEKLRQTSVSGGRGWGFLGWIYCGWLTTLAGSVVLAFLG